MVNFKQFVNPPFPHSKIKRIVYHASWKEGATTRAKETGLYFSDFPRTKAFGRYATAAYINITNPFYGNYEDIEYDWVFPGVTEDFLEWAQDNHLTTTPSFEEYLEYLEARSPNPYEDLSIVQAIKKAGFDGIFGRDSHGGTKEYVVFQPAQVSVIKK